MRTLLTASFVSLPAAAQAMDMYGSNPACGCISQHGILLVGALYAVIAVLGYWVLTQSVKETASNCVKRVGDVTGSVLVIVGLLGLLCSVVGHMRDAMRRSCGPGPAMMAPGQPQGMGMGMGMMPPGHPPVGDEQAPVPAPKKEKGAKPK